MKKTLISIVILLIVGVGAWYVFAKGGLVSGGNKTNSETVATVNGAKITRADLTKLETQLAAQQGITATTTEALSQVQSQAINSLIAQELLKQATQKAGVVASSSEVDAQLQALKTQFGSDDAYQQALKAQGVTESALKDQISSNLAIQTFLDKQLNLSSVGASDQEIQAAYDQASAGNKNVPALKDVKDQVKQFVIQQKQQQLIAAFVEQLKSQSQVKILI